MTQCDDDALPDSQPGHGTCTRPHVNLLCHPTCPDSCGREGSSTNTHTHTHIHNHITSYS